VGPYTGEELAAMIGEHSPLKDWQVSQAIRKLKAASRMYPDAEYREMVEFPEAYADAKEFRDRTVDTVVHDTGDGGPAEISLGSMIDHLQPCNWNFPENLDLTLHAINGDLKSIQPFAAHGRNVCWNPIAEKMRTLAGALREFCQDRSAGAVLDVLGERTPVKVELARRLERKISGVFAHSGLPPELEPLRLKLEALPCVQGSGVRLVVFYAPWPDLFWPPCENWARGGIMIYCSNERRRAGIGFLNGELRIAGIDDDMIERGAGGSLAGSLPDEEALVTVVEALVSEGLEASLQAFKKVGGKRLGS
jgi:hypothetical protein